MANKREMKLLRFIPLYAKMENPEKSVKLVFWSNKPKEQVIEYLANKLNPLGALILYLNIQKEMDSSEYLWTAIIEFSTDRGTFEIHLNQALQSMSKSNLIDKYYYVFPLRNGYIVDHNIYSLYDARRKNVVLFSYENLLGLFVLPRKEYGDAFGKMLVNKIGELFGRTLGEEMKRDCLPYGIRACLEILHSQGELKGFLHLKSTEVFEDSEGIYIRVSFDRLIEEEILRENGIKDCGEHQRGVYKGFLEQLLGIKLNDDAIEEVRCTSKGDAESVFVIKLPHGVKL
ncbi:MAG: hypothetical protein QXR98_03060 [Fervidicoccaceae archaeon]